MERTCDRLSLERLRRHLTTEVVGHRVYIFGTVDSTNHVLAGLADRGAAEGTVVLAEAQTAGRGRHGAPWFSPEGANLYVSVLFRPHLVPRELPLFAPIASLALAETVWLEGAAARIKWPSRLEKWQHTFVTRGPEAVRLAWQARDALRGRRLEARVGDDICAGRCLGIDGDGRLLVEDDAGQTRHIIAGAIRVLDAFPESHRI